MTRQTDSTASPFPFAAPSAAPHYPSNVFQSFPLCSRPRDQARPGLSGAARHHIPLPRTADVSAVVPPLGYTHSDVPQSYDGCHSADGLEGRAANRERVCVSRAFPSNYKRIPFNIHTGTEL